MTEKYPQIFGFVAVLIIVLAMLAITHHIVRPRPAGPSASKPVAVAASAHNTACTALGRLQNVGYTIAPLGQPAAPTRLGVSDGPTLRVRGGVPVQWVGQPVRRCRGPGNPDRVCIGDVCVAEVLAPAGTR